MRKKFWKAEYCMLYTIPHYYKKFQCIAGECPDTCCAGWQIVIDDRTREKYRKAEGTFGNRLHNSIDWKESCFQQYEGRCAFLNDENLCDIYQEAGKEMLCRTCRNYPRHIEEFEGSREISLSLSCPEAARLILGCREPVRFLTAEKAGEEEYEDFDFFLYTKLTDARDLMIRLLQDRREPVSLRIAMVLSLGHDLQRRIRSGQLFLVDQLLERYGKEGAFRRMEERVKPYRADRKSRSRLVRELFEIFGELELLKADWPRYVKRAEQGLALEAEQMAAGEETAQIGAEKKAERMASGEETAQTAAGEKSGVEGQSGLQDEDSWEIWMEQLMVYFVFTYFCGAVYDENAYGKIKLAVVSTLLICEITRGVSGDADGNELFLHLTESAWKYSKEIEHSDVNLSRLEQCFREKFCCSLENLLRVVLS